MSSNLYSISQNLKVQTHSWRHGEHVHVITGIFLLLIVLLRRSLPRRCGCFLLLFCIGRSQTRGADSGCEEWRRRDERVETRGLRDARRRESGGRRSGARWSVSWDMLKWCISEDRTNRYIPVNLVSIKCTLFLKTTLSRYDTKL